MSDPEIGGALLGVVFSRLSGRDRLAGGQRVNRRLRTVMRATMRDEPFLRLIYIMAADQLPSAPSGPELPSDAGLAFGDGAILDQLGDWFKWIIENQDQILALIEAIIAIFTTFGV